MNEVKSVLSNVHPDNALLPQLRVNRGKLSPESFMVDHVLDSLTQVFSSHNSIFQDIADSKFALVALGRASSAKFKNFYKNVKMVFEATKSTTVKEEQALNKECKGIRILALTHLSGKHCVPVDHPHLYLPAVCFNQVERPASRNHMFKFTQFRKPAHWSDSPQIWSRQCSASRGER